MSSQNDLCYEFGGFTLDLANRTLTHGDRRVELVGKEFDILAVLVREHDRLVASTELAGEIWGDRAPQYRKNLPHHIARIRKVLGCDARVPKFIKTFHWSHSYRFIAPVIVVEPTEDRGTEVPNQRKSSPFEIGCHLFVPMFLGVRAWERPGLVNRSNDWFDYKQFKLENRTLNSLQSGFAVWHLQEEKKFTHLWEFAAWRREFYKQILSCKHALKIQTREFLKSTATDTDLKRIIGRPGYVFSAQVLRSTTRRNPEDIKRVVKVLSTPSSLESSETSDDIRTKLEETERKLLESDKLGGDLHEFGLSGIDLGFASWDGVCYMSETGKDLEPTIVEFEIGVQALWWMCKCIAEIFLEGDADEREAVRNFIPDVKRQFAKLRNISATESPSQRTMREAILKTSRLKEMVDEVIELNNDAGP